jgi:hypothetical protein
MHKLQKNAQRFQKKSFIFGPRISLSKLTVKKEDTVNSVRLKYLQKLVGKDWNVEMPVSPSRESIHSRQPRIQADRQVKYTDGMPSTQRACPVHRQAGQVHRGQAQYTESMPSTQAGRSSTQRACPVHREHAQYTGWQVKYTEGMPSTQAGMPSTQARRSRTQRACPVHRQACPVTGRQDQYTAGMPSTQACMLNQIYVYVLPNYCISFLISICLSVHVYTSVCLLACGSACLIVAVCTSVSLTDSVWLPV